MSNDTWQMIDAANLCPNNDKVLFDGSRLDIAVGGHIDHLKFDFVAASCMA